MRDDLLFEEEIESGWLCAEGHPLRLVAEGYAICGDPSLEVWWPWKLTPPARGYWHRYPTSRNWGDSSAEEIFWVSSVLFSKEEALDYIHADIEAHRNLPFDEEAERARLVAV